MLKGGDSQLEDQFIGKLFQFGDLALIPIQSEGVILLTIRQEELGADEGANTSPPAGWPPFQYQQPGWVTPASPLSMPRA